MTACINEGNSDSSAVATAAVEVERPGGTLAVLRRKSDAGSRGRAVQGLTRLHWSVEVSPSYSARAGHAHTRIAFPAALAHGPSQHRPGASAFRRFHPMPASRRTAAVSLGFASCCALLILLAVGSCRPAPTSAAKPLRVAIDLWPGYYPPILADELGYLKTAGVTLDLHVPQDTHRMVADFAAHKHDVICVALGDIILATRAEPDIRLILCSDESAGADQILGHGELRDAAQIRGKRIGTTVGGFGELLVRRFLERHDVRANEISLVTTDAALADSVAIEVDRQIALLPRARLTRDGWDEFGAIIVVQSLGEAVELANRIASEHVELMLDEPLSLQPKIRNAGAIFLGHHTPEAIGDYVGGSNHVLPTARSARYASGLGVLDFMKRTSLLGCDPSSLAELAPAAVTLAETEGLSAHGRSVSIRLNR